MTKLLRRLLPTALVTLVLLGTAQPAAAHTRLVSTSPSAGQAVAGPAEVRLDFSDDVTAGLSTIVVTGPDGDDRAAGSAEETGPTVTQALAGPLPGGAWTIAYRVVSADGHPITGTVPFVVEAAAVPVGPEPVASAPAPPAPSPPVPETAPDLAPTSSAPADGSGPAPVVWLPVVLVALVLAGLVLRRRLGAPGGAAGTRRG